MLYAAAFLIELVVLFFLSKMVTKRISRHVYHATRSQKATIYFMAFLFFPGTVIHELSHLIMAGLLFVPVGHVELWPKLEGQYVKLGSVQVAETDIFRRFLIGAAPFFFGTALLLGLLFFAAQNNLFTNYIYILLMAYAAFEIGNTMFSSNKDMEGALELLVTLAFFGVVFYFLGLRIPAASFETIFANQTLVQMFEKGTQFLFIPLGLDILILLWLKIIPLRRF